MLYNRETTASRMLGTTLIGLAIYLLSHYLSSGAQSKDVRRADVSRDLLVDYLEAVIEHDWPALRTTD